MICERAHQFYLIGDMACDNFCKDMIMKIDSRKYAEVGNRFYNRHAVEHSYCSSDCMINPSYFRVSLDIE
jgi:hypothetical protein